MNFFQKTNCLICGFPDPSFRRHADEFCQKCPGLFTWTQDSELPRGNDCPGASVTSRSHDDLLSWGNVAPGQLHCPGASSSSSDHCEFIWIPLVFTNCYREWILNTFTYFWCFLKLLIGKFIPNINNEHAPGATLRSVHMEKSYLGKAGYPVLYNW